MFNLSSAYRRQLADGPVYPSSVGASSLSTAFNSYLDPELEANVQNSIYYHAALLIFSLLKIATTLLALTYNVKNSSQWAISFLKCMTFYEILNISGLILKILTISQEDFSFVPSSQNLAANQDIIDNESFRSINLRIEQGNNVFAISKEAEKKNRLAAIISSTTHILYYGIFFYGQILFFNSNSRIFRVSFDTDDLALVHILCGYIYIGMPILFIIGTCLSIPALLLYAHITARKDTQAPMSEDLVQKLPVVTYTKPLPGNSECSICILEYKKDDRVIQLKCSPMHHFHEQCFKKWIKVNGLCPLCRCSLAKQV